jgi:hypothetical protein
MIWAEIVTGLGVLGLVYTFLRNFKNDITGQITRLEKRIDAQDDRIFFLATGKTLQEAILLEKMKRIGEGKNE